MTDMTSSDLTYISLINNHLLVITNKSIVLLKSTQLTTRKYYEEWQDEYCDGPSTWFDWQGPYKLFLGMEAQARNNQLHKYGKCWTHSHTT